MPRAKIMFDAVKVDLSAAANRAAHAKADGAVFRMNAEVEEVRRQPDGVFEVALGGASPEVTARANRIN